MITLDRSDIDERFVLELDLALLALADRHLQAAHETTCIDYAADRAERFMRVAKFWRVWSEPKGEKDLKICDPA